MNNFEWLYENDKDTLVSLLFPCESKFCLPCDGEEYRGGCRLESTPYCEIKDLDMDNFVEWLMAEHIDDCRTDSPESDRQDGLTVTDDGQDSREKLESDFADSLCLFAHYAHDHYERETVMQMVADRKSEFTAFLDRQATITRFQETANQPNSGFVAQKQPESTENATAKDEIRDFDVWSVAYEIYCAGGWVDNGNEPNPPTDGIWKLLDRQAAITEREVLNCVNGGKGYMTTWERMNAELQAKVDELEKRLAGNARHPFAETILASLDSRENELKLQEKVEELGRENEKLKSELDARMYWVNLADRIDELEAENARLSSDELHWRSEAKRLEGELKTQRNNFDQATGARDYWKEKLSGDPGYVMPLSDESVAKLRSVVERKIAESRHLNIDGSEMRRLHANARIQPPSCSFNYVDGMLDSIGCEGMLFTCEYSNELERLREENMELMRKLEDSDGS